MSKSVALIYYSQSGQSQRLAWELKDKLHNASLDVVDLPIVSRRKFAFPWKVSQFFGQMPRCIEGKSDEIQEENLVSLKDVSGVVLIYPVWFLSAALPMQALLKTKWASRELKDKKLVQVLTCRNMWFKAASKTHQILKTMGVEYLGHVAICDPSPNWASLITTPLWMLKGNPHLIKSLPPAGIPPENLKNMAGSLATAIQRSFVNDERFEMEREAAETLSRAEAVNLIMEIVGHTCVFRPWAWLINRCPSSSFKQVLLLGFRVNLVLAILFLVPVLGLFSILFRGALRSLAQRRLSYA